MSLNKAVQHGKEHRKPYIGEKATDKTKRNHGSDPTAAHNRQFSTEKRKMACSDTASEQDHTEENHNE